MKQYSIYLLLGWLFAPIIQFIEKYVFNDWDYLRFLFIIAMVDTALGTYKALLKRQFSSRSFGACINKIVVYMAALITTHVMISFTVHNKAYPVFSWFDTVVFSAIIIREAVSIFENIAVIEPGVLPSSMLKYLKGFDSFTGKEKLSDNAKEEML
jgi:toxin secretion/phage lysis holin